MINKLFINLQLLYEDYSPAPEQLLYEDYSPAPEQLLYEDYSPALMFNMILLIPLKLRILLQKYADFTQKIYNKITLILLETPIIKNVIMLWHKFLFAFRIYSIEIGNHIEKYISLNMLALILSIITSRLHIAGYFILFCLLFLRLDFAVLSMARFYKKYPEALYKLYHPEQQRHMWSKAGKIAQEVASNPQVQTVAVGVMGALAWKTLDVYDTQTQKVIAEHDRTAENARHAEEMATRKTELEAENRRHVEQLAEARQAREDENRRHAEQMAEARQAREDENRRHAEEMAMRKAELEKETNK